VAAAVLLNPVQVTLGAVWGGAGGDESFLVCIWTVLERHNHAGIRIGLGREEVVRLKQTTAVTLLSKVHPALGNH